MKTNSFQILGVIKGNLYDWGSHKIYDKLWLGSAFWRESFHCVTLAIVFDNLLAKCDTSLENEVKGDLDWQKKFHRGGGGN